MSGLEVVGAIASTAQIAIHVVKAAAFLSEILERIKHAPDRIRQHAQQIGQLVEIVQHIQQTQSQNSIALCNQLQYTISQASNLKDLLDKVLGQYMQPSLRSRYWKLLKGNKEEKILVALQNLEREKTGLALCLAATNTELLQEVRREVRMTDREIDGQRATFPAPPLSPALTSDGNEYSPKVELGGAQAIPRGANTHDEEDINTDRSREIKKAEDSNGDKTFQQNEGGGELPKTGPHSVEFLIENEDMKCEAGFMQNGVAGNIPQAGPQKFKILNKGGVTSGTGRMSNGVAFPGSENLFASNPGKSCP